MVRKNYIIIFASTALAIVLFLIYYYSFLLPMRQKEAELDAYMLRMQQEKQAESQKQEAIKQQAELERQIELQRQSEFQKQAQQQRQQIVSKQQSDEFAVRQAEVISKQKQQYELTSKRKAFLDDCLKTAHQRYRDSWDFECRMKIGYVNCVLPSNIGAPIKRNYELEREGCHDKANKVQLY